MSSQWWDPDGPMRPLHDLTPLRGKFILDNCLKKPETAIDFGCGAGILTEWLSEADIKCNGLDISDKLIEAAKRHATLSKLDINYICSSSLNKITHKVDLITCMEVLEHCSDHEDLIAMFAGKLKKNGTLCISTINNTWESFFKIIIAGEYLLNIVPKGTHKKPDFIKPSRLIRMAELYRLKLKAISGIEYFPYSRTGKLTENLAGNYILAFEKL